MTSISCKVIGQSIFYQVKYVSALYRMPPCLIKFLKRPHHSKIIASVATQKKKTQKTPKNKKKTKAGRHEAERGLSRLSLHGPPSVYQKEGLLLLEGHLRQMAKLNYYLPYALNKSTDCFEINTSRYKC